MKVNLLVFWVYVMLINVTKFVKTVDLQNWENYKKEFDKHYATPKEEKRRMKIFKQNLREIAKHNKKFKMKKVTFTMGINQFTDLTKEELNEGQCSHSTFGNEFGEMLRTSTAGSVVTSLPPYLGTAPEFKNWTDEGAVTRVKNQDIPARCGSCWTFAVAGVIESHNFIRTGKLIELSEQNLLDCVAKYLNITGHTCRGGTTRYPFHYIIDNHGISTEKSYPYKAKQGGCRYKDENKGATIQGFNIVKPKDEELLKSIVGLIGPVTALLYTDDTLHKQGGDIYTNPKCKNSSVNHAVLVVGYGTEKNQPYWLVKNTWGPKWGINGYFKIRRGTNECNIAKENLYPVF